MIALALLEVVEESDRGSLMLCISPICELNLSPVYVTNVPVKTHQLINKLYLKSPSSVDLGWRALQLLIDCTTTQVKSCLSHRDERLLDAEQQLLLAVVGDHDVSEMEEPHHGDEPRDVEGGPPPPPLLRTSQS